MFNRQIISTVTGVVQSAKSHNINTCESLLATQKLIHTDWGC